MIPQDFNVSETHAEPMIEAHRMADDSGRKPVTSICRFPPFIVAEVGLT